MTTQDPRSILSQEQRLALGLGKRGRISKNAVASLPAVRAALRKGVTGHLEEMSRIAYGADEKSSDRIKALSYLVDRYLGKIPDVGIGHTPAEKDEARETTATLRDAYLLLVRQIPPDDARRMMDILTEGLRKVGKLPDGAEVVLDGGAGGVGSEPADDDLESL